MPFRRKSLRETISQELPFYRIEETLCGKTLLKARKLWRQGTSLFHDLAIPWSFNIEDLEEIVKDIPVAVKREIFEYCGRGMLLEKRGIDSDIAEFLILDALFHYGETCDSYFAYIVGAACCEFLFFNSSGDDAKRKFAQDAESAYLKAIAKSSDPRAYAMYAEFAFKIQCQDPNKQSKNPETAFEKSINELDLTLESFAGLEANVSKHRLKEFRHEWRESFSVFDVHFTYATLLHNKISILLKAEEERAKRSNETKTKKVYEPVYRDLIIQLQEEKRNHLKNYIDAAPICHWNVPTACYMLSIEWVSRKSPPTGADPKELYKRNIDDVKNSIKYFEKATESKKILYKWFPSSCINTGEKFYKEALQLQTLFVEYGYLESVPTQPDYEADVNDVGKVTNLHSENESGKGYSNMFTGLFTQENHANVQLIYLFILTALLAEPILTYLGLISS